MDVEYRAVPLRETKARDGATGAFSGYGAVFHNEDAQGDVIEPGAFKATLHEWAGRGKLPPMLLQHGGGMFGGGADDLLPVGQWTAMQENRRGLQVEGQLFALATERGQYIYEGLKAGVLDGLSIGFKTRTFTAGTRAGQPARTLTDLDLWEVSIVTFPANPSARVTAVKALTVETLRPLEDYLRDAGYTRGDAKHVVNDVRKYLQRDAGEPVREQRDAAAAGALVDRLVTLRTTEALQSLLATITAGGIR